MTYKKRDHVKVIGTSITASCDILNKRINHKDIAVQWNRWCVSKEAVALLPPLFQDERLVRVVAMACGEEKEQFQPKMLSSGWWLFICRDQSELPDVFDWSDARWVMTASPDKNTCFNRNYHGQTPFPDQLAHPERFQSVCDIREFLNDNRDEIYQCAVFAVHDASTIVKFEFVAESSPFVLPPAVQPPLLKMADGKPIELDTSKEDGSEPTKDVAERLLFYAYSAGINYLLQLIVHDKQQSESYERIMIPLEVEMGVAPQNINDHRRAMAAFYGSLHLQGSKITWNCNPSLAKAISARVAEIDKIPQAEAESHWNLLYQLAQPLIG